MDYNELLKTSERCINEEPAACTAWCPLHVDIAAFMNEMEKGDFIKAYKVLEKRMPFPRLIGMICDHPCETVCVRKNVDGAVSIGELERAAVRYGYTPPKKALSIQKNFGNVAVVGGGVSGITAAFDLNKKGFAVTVFEQTERIGGSLWHCAGEEIDRNILEEELKTVYNLGIRVLTGRQISSNNLAQLVNEYSAVYLGTGEWETQLRINPETFQVEYSSIFAGGRLVNKNDSLIHAVSTGKRTAASIERYVKKISMNASREREGAFVTPLNYDTEDVKPAAGIEKTSRFYSETEAAREAKRCLKCKCVQCLKACSHMKKFNIAPKGYIKQININENVIMGTRYANKMINSCTLCGLCREQCRYGVDMKAVVRNTRESMAEKGKMPPSAHDFALRDMEFSNSDKFFMVKSPPPIPAEKRADRERELFAYPRITYSKYAQSVYNGAVPGTEKADYLFYPGCQLSASSPAYVEKAYLYLLSRIKEGVGIMLGCCGAPADWAGRQDLMKESAARLKNAWAEAGKPTFILACSSCYQIFEKYLPDVPVVSLWEIILRYGLPEDAVKGCGRTLSIHDACSTRRNGTIQDCVRRISSELDYTIAELKYSKDTTKCCGYGGLVYYANREQAKDFVQDRVSESPNDLLVYCAMCKDLFVDGGKRTYHILDLLFGEDLEDLGLQKMPNLSQRHMNRTNLKNKLLKELWNEAPEMELEEKNKLIIPQDVRAVMEERYILLEDIEKVVEYSMSSGARFLNQKNSSFLASLRIVNVTYWVCYEEKEDGVHISRVYSHRMEVVEE
jgi:glutamate synthase (NADPH) small chain